jgi:hypothetical protein
MVESSWEKEQEQSVHFMCRFNQRRSFNNKGRSFNNQQPTMRPTWRMRKDEKEDEANSADFPLPFQK